MKKPVKLLISGIAIFIVGGIILPLVLMALIIIPVFRVDPNIEFLIPGSIEINVEEAGRYYVWNEYETIYEGKTYSKPKDLPDDLRISMHKKDGALQLDFVGDRSISMSSGSSSRKSIGYFQITEAGDYVVDVQGESDQRVFSVGRSHLDLFRFLLLIFIGGPVCLLSSFVGFILVIVAIIKMIQSKRC